MQSIDVLDYGLRINEDEFEIFTNGCVLNSTLSLIYAISVVTAGGAEKIVMTGIDEYETSSSRLLEMINVLKQYESKIEVLRLIAITPTSYLIEQCSIFQLF